MERDYEEFQFVIFDKAKDVARFCDFSGNVQNSFKRMLEDGSATKEQIKKHINTFIEESDEAISQLKDVRTAILSVLEHYSK